jgi:2-polyprenyl-6-hydroxyphenyl methylase/3-demethylubiquinone-9 3-methyltransferase
MVAPATKDVRTLFNDKAGSWQRKYGQNGKLSSRLERFMARLSELSPPPARILDFGCGTGEMAAAIVGMGYEVAACDIAERMIEVARSAHSGSGVEWVCLNPEWKVLPFADSSFDGIVASSVFEYLVDVRRVAAELSRVLRPGGILLLTVPNPFSYVRKLEGLLQWAIKSRWLPSPLRRVHRIDSYVTYLHLSHNRFDGSQWQSVLAAAHFEPLDERDFSTSAWRRQAKAPLILLAAKRGLGG